MAKFFVDTAKISEEKESAESLNIVEVDYQQVSEEENVINKNAITCGTGYLVQRNAERNISVRPEIHWKI